MEERGIGRPSTYAATIGTIQDRGYVFTRGSGPGADLAGVRRDAAARGALRRPGRLRLHRLDGGGPRPDRQRRGGAGRLARSGSTSATRRRSAEGLRAPRRRPRRDRRPRDLDDPARRRHGRPRRSLRTVRRGGHPRRRRRATGEVRLDEAPAVPETPRRATITDDIAPDEMTPAKARELLDAAADDGRVLGQDPVTGHEIVAKAGRYGPYVTEVLPERDDDAAPKGGKAAARPSRAPRRCSRTWTSRRSTSTPRCSCSRLPRVVGDGRRGGRHVVEITAQNGRYGPYLKKGTDSRSLVTEQQLFDDHPRRGARDLRPAQAARAGRRGRRSRSSAPTRCRGKPVVGQGRPVRPLRHRRRDQRHAAQGRRPRVDHARARRSSCWPRSGPRVRRPASAPAKKTTKSTAKKTTAKKAAAARSGGSTATARASARKA